MNVLFGNLERLFLPSLLVRSPKSVTGRLLPRLSFLSCLPNIACKFLQNHFNPLLENLFRIIKIIRQQSVLKCLKTIGNCHLPVQGFISNLFQADLPPDYEPMLYLREPSHAYFLPLVERTIVGLPHSIGKLFQGEFSLLQADWWFAFCIAQVRRIVALIICIVIVVDHLRQGGQFCNVCNIWIAWFHWWLELFCWEANRGFTRCAGRRFS